MFLFLLLVNGLIYVWYAIYNVPAHAVATVETPDAPRLVLLSEQSRLPEGQPDAQPAEAEPQDSVAVSETPDSKPGVDTGKDDTTQCFTLGPFMNKDDLSGATRGLMVTGRPFEKRVSKKKELIGYWVVIPPFKTEADAYAKVQELKQAGDKHHYVVKDPAVGINAVSLGVFRDRLNADRRLAQVKKLGHEVKVQTRYRQDPVYWLDFTESRNAQALDIRQFVGAQRLPTACKEIASKGTVP